nr:ribonuclease H-like domain-containing protein [Tanacetum cinerariifolium]
MESQSETTQTVSRLKLLVLKTGEYDLWSMSMKKYLNFTDHALWEVIVNGDYVSSVASASSEGLIPPKTAEQRLARKNKLKAKSTLMLPILDENLVKFHACKDAKSLWEAIKNRTKDECYNGHRRGYFARECRVPRKQGNRNRDSLTSNAPVDTSTTNALVHQVHQVQILRYILALRMFKIIYALQKQYDQQCEAFNKSNLEIIGYKIGLESLEAIIVVHEKNEAVYEEDIAFLKYDVQVKDITIIDLKNQLENALKEKDDLKLKLEKFETSYKNLTKLIDSQISATDKTGLGYDGRVNESEVFNNMVNSCESNEDDNQVNDRFKKSEGYHVVPPPYTSNYMPLKADLSFAGLDDSIFKFNVSETFTTVPKVETNASTTSKDSLKKPKTVRSSDPIIEDWKSDSEDENVFKPKEKLGDGFKFRKKACFVCGNINYLIKGCNFYENKMLVNNKEKITGPKEIRPVWDNTARVNHQNKLTHPHPKRNFVPTAVLTKSGQVPVNTAKQSSHRAATLVSTARHVNINASRPHVNNALPTTYSYFKSYSPDQGIFDNGCSRHMTRKIPASQIIKKLMVDLLHLEEMLKELLDESQVLLKVPRNNNMYSFDLKNVVPIGGLTCLFAKATLDESNLWHRRLGRINFKTMNKLVRENLARGLPLKSFKNDHTCVACQKGKQHKASCPKSSDDEVADNARKKSTKVLKKENEVQDPTKEGDKNDQENDVRDQEEAPRKQFEQESERLFGLWEVTNTNNTNRLNIVSSPVNAVSSSFTTVDPGRKRAQMNEFESMFGQDKDANGNMIFTHVSAAGSTYVYLGGSTPVNAATLPNADLPTNPLMPDLEDTAN